MPTNDISNYVSGYTSSDVTTVDSTPVIGAQGAGVHTLVWAITISNAHATVGTRVDLLDGATVKWTTHALANGGGGHFPLPRPLVGSANTSWNVQCGTSGATVRCSLVGEKVST